MNMCLYCNSLLGFKAVGKALFRAHVEGQLKVNMNGKF